MRRYVWLALNVLVVMGLMLVPVVAAQGTGVQGGLPEFNVTAAEEEGYWYSRYNLGNLVFRSGLGDTFKPEMSMIKKMIQMADANPGDGDTAVPPQHPALLRSVYASGDPHYTQKLNVKDFATQRWDPATFDKRVTSRALGWTMLKETQWAKQFHVDNHFGTPQDNFGAQWRFVGMVLTAEAKMQAQYALKNLMNGQGLIADSDGNVDWTGQWVMLEAFSDLGNTLSVDALPHSTGNRYRDPKVGKMIHATADKLFQALASRQPASVEELSLAIQSLVWYAAETGNPSLQAQALARITSFGDALAKASLKTATEKAFAVRGLIEAYRASGDARYLQAAGDAFHSLAGEYDAAHGVFTSQDTYTIDDVAVIMGALNAARYFGGNVINQMHAESLFAGFFESAVDMSGLQQSVPPVGVAKGKFEQNEPPIFYGYPSIPKPPMAGGKYGIAPVFASKIHWTGSGWEVVDRRFDAAGAMHASNEFIWFHKDEVNGFPEIKVLATALPETGGQAPALPLSLLVALFGLALLAGGAMWQRHARMS